MTGRRPISAWPWEQTLHKKGSDILARTFFIQDFSLAVVRSDGEPYICETTIPEILAGRAAETSPDVCYLLPTVEPHFPGLRWFETIHRNKSAFLR
jgi:hypothetical protein